MKKLEKYKIEPQAKFVIFKVKHFLEIPTICHDKKAFDGVWHNGFFHKHKSYGIPGQIFGLISSFLS